MSHGRRKALAWCLGGSAIAVLGIVAVLGYPWVQCAWKWRRLKALAGMELKALEPERVNDLLGELRSGLKDIETDEGRWFPYMLFPMRDQDRDVFVLVFISPLVGISGRSAAAFVTYNFSGEVLARGAFSTGGRVNVAGVELTAAPGGQQAIRVVTRSAWGGGGLNQLYALIGGNLELVRLESLKQSGSLSMNDYTTPNLTVGPLHSRTAAQWRNRLMDGTWAERLTALIWLGGKHQLQWQPIHYQESDEEVNTFRSLATDSEVKNAVNYLLADPDPWTREAASAASKTMDRIR